MTTETEHLLAVLAEELGEVQKHCHKAIRFGLDDRDPTIEDSLPERELITLEMHDVYAALEMLSERGLVRMSTSRTAIDAKKMKVLKFMEYARRAGALAEAE